MTELVEASRLTRGQKKELGILPRQIFANSIQLFKDGDLTKDMSAAEMAFVYAAEMADSPSYSSAWGKVSGVDWEGITMFIEKVFEMLLKFLPLILPLFV